MSDYSYKLDVFEGPLELLLHLIEKHKIEICDIPIVEITSQYISYLDNWNHFDIDYSSEFLVMASTLLQIKSRMLLPKLVTTCEEEDPRDELVSRLVEFKHIKELTALLIDKSDRYGYSFTRPEEVSVIGKDKVYRLELAHLYELFTAAYTRKPEVVEASPKVHVEKEALSLDEMMQLVRIRVQQEEILFSILLQEANSRSEMVTIFLAILELLRQHHITLYSDETDQDSIFIRAVDDKELDNEHHDERRRN